MAFQKSLFQCVFDSSSLINIERNRKMTILRRRRGEVLIPSKVEEEVNQPNTPLHRFITRFRQQVLTPFQNNEEQEYLRVRSQRGIHDADAAAVAIALKRRLTLAIDDKRAREKAGSHGIETLSWQDFIGS